MWFLKLLSYFNIIELYGQISLNYMAMGNFKRATDLKIQIAQMAVLENV